MQAAEKRIDVWVDVEKGRAGIRAARADTSRTGRQPPAGSTDDIGLNSEPAEAAWRVLDRAAALLRQGARSAACRAHAWGLSAGAHNSPAARPRRPSRSGMVGAVGGREVWEEADLMWYAQVELKRPLRACVVALRPPGWGISPPRLAEDVVSFEAPSWASRCRQTQWPTPHWAQLSSPGGLRSRGPPAYDIWGQCRWGLGAGGS